MTMPLKGVCSITSRYFLKLAVSGSPQPEAINFFCTGVAVWACAVGAAHNDAVTIKAPSFHTARNKCLGFFMIIFLESVLLSRVTGGLVEDRSPRPRPPCRGIVFALPIILHRIT